MAFRFHVSRRSARFVGAAWLGLVLAAGAGAQVKLDGSLGGPALNLTGPHFQILPTYGRQVGRNLFHSFSAFNLLQGDVARFSGPPEVRNVLARVTGGSVSSIDGTIQSAIPGANFFLMNPAGIVFGPNASIDVGGAFTATTADYIRLADGGRFPASVAERPILTSADPRAFGFMPSRADPLAAPQPILVNGAKLNVPYPSLSLIAGAVTESGDAAVTSDYGVVRKIETGVSPTGRAESQLPREVSALTGDLAPPPVITPGSVVLDGTVGPAGPLAGPVYQIGAELGRQQGGNLFQSFSDFQIHAGEVAIFNGPASVQNLLVRVTGANPSAINGALKSEIPGVNLFFLNPRGISFGANSSLAIDGSFLATTADYLRFRDGRLFPARPVAGVANLSGEAVTGVGFLTGELAARGGAAAISVNDGVFDAATAGADFSPGVGRSLWLIGGGVTLEHRQVTAPGGAVALLALNAAGEVAVDVNNPYAVINTDGFAAHAPVTLLGGTVIDVTGARAGRVTLRGSDVTLDNAGIYAAELGIDVKATRSAVLQNSSLASTSQQGAAQGGDLRVEAPEIVVRDLSALSSETYAGSTGDAGNIWLRANRVSLSGNSQISASVNGQGRGGDIQIHARDFLDISRDGSGGRVAAIAFDAVGPPGEIVLHAGRVFIGSGGNIASETDGPFPAGKTSISAGLLELAGGVITAKSAGAGNAGSIFIAADRVRIDGLGWQGLPEDAPGLNSRTTNPLGTARGGSAALPPGPSR